MLFQKYAKRHTQTQQGRGSMRMHNTRPFLGLLRALLVVLTKAPGYDAQIMLEWVIRSQMLRRSAAMLVGLCQLTLRLHTTHSLKDKRSLIKGLISRLRNKLNAGVAEVDAQDIWGKAVIALSTVSTSEAVIREVFRHAESIAEQFPGIEVIDTYISFS